MGGQGEAEHNGLLPGLRNKRLLGCTAPGCIRTACRVDMAIRLPMPGPLFLLRPLLEAQLRREVRAAALEDKHDIEQRG